MVGPSGPGSESEKRKRLVVAKLVVFEVSIARELIGNRNKRVSKLSKTGKFNAIRQVAKSVESAAHAALHVLRRLDEKARRGLPARKLY